MNNNHNISDDVTWSEDHTNSVDDVNQQQQQRHHESNALQQQQQATEYTTNAFSTELPDVPPIVVNDDDLVKQQEQQRMGRQSVSCSRPGAYFATTTTAIIDRNYVNQGTWQQNYPFDDNNHAMNRYDQSVRLTAPAFVHSSTNNNNNLHCTAANHTGAEDYNPNIASMVSSLESYEEEVQETYQQKKRDTSVNNCSDLETTFDTAKQSILISTIVPSEPLTSGNGFHHLLNRESMTFDKIRTTNDGGFRDLMDQESSTLYKLRHQRVGIFSIPGVMCNNNNINNNNAVHDSRTSDMNLSEMNWNGLLERHQVPSNNSTKGLVVAFEVEETDNETNGLPLAIHFHPDAKLPPRYNRRFRMYLFLMITASMIGVIGAVFCLVVTKRETPQFLPYRATLGIRENIEQVIINKKELNDMKSPYRKALQWIMFTDPMELTPESPTFFQRYIMAYFYFATSRQEPWTSGCAPSDVKEAECSTIYLRDRHTGNDQATILKYGFRWLSNIDEYKWVGVKCDSSNQVMQLDISGFIKNAGTFPEGLTLLPFLHSITLDFIEMQGPIPNSLWKMKNLYSFNATGNRRMSGIISDQIYESRSLQIVSLSRNCFTGDLTKNISNLQDMKIMDLSGNLFSGPIPDEIGDLQNLDNLELSNNRFTGTLPSTLGQLRTVSIISIGRNKITGTIPNIFRGFRGLKIISLDNNLFTGIIPDSIYENAKMTGLYLNDNFFHGRLSNKIAKAISLKQFTIHNNQLTGELPSRYGRSALERVYMHGNQFNGTVPLKLCSLVQSRQVSFLSLDCLATSRGNGYSKPEIICPLGCCTKCCNSDGRSCIDMPRAR